MAEKQSEGIGETIKTIVYALLIAGVIRTLFFQPFWIPSGSMKSTLLVGDFMFVNKMAYGYSKYSCPWALCPISGRILSSEPERGDIIVFKHPTRGVDYIKRLIGLPGDKVQMKAGQLYINDKAAPLKTIDNFIEVKLPQGPLGSTPACYNQPVALGGSCEKEAFKETLPNGVEHTVLNVRTARSDDTPVFNVPAGHYFFMGDNRDNSQDSRVPLSLGGVGYVPAEYLIGRADRVIFSSAGKRMLYFWTWRADRFFKGLE
ncbi:signal peptidase I [Amylibacter sp. SFDW26]|uniref:signal peptidase I n=1 Tax=Amylibacter sp. SFDW26 TaxID=2652722 RepID=UPI001261494E|nr:signal peptidase I [Amylibacter sp. SFDW26]KAB7614810.1 signal peptidase I [Amylibacter sp. SFDW26]